MDECVREVFVEQIPLVAFACSKARNAHKTADFVTMASRVFCHGLIPRTRLTDGSGCQTTRRIPLVPGTVGTFDPAAGSEV